MPTCSLPDTQQLALTAESLTLMTFVQVLEYAEGGDLAALMSQAKKRKEYLKESQVQDDVQTAGPPSSLPRVLSRLPSSIVIPRRDRSNNLIIV